MPERDLENVTGEQLRAARALLRLEQKDIAFRSGVSLPTIKVYEKQRGPISGNPAKIEKVIAVFERSGIVFERGADGAIGVRLK